MLLPGDQSRQEAVDPEPIRVLAAVVFRAGRVLVAQRASQKRHGGLWEFPGGKIEPGETTLEAARRELAEELQLAAISTERHLVSFRDPASPFVIEFVEVVAEGEPSAVEHTAVAWVEPTELSVLPLAPADARFAEWMQNSNR